MKIIIVVIMMLAFLLQSKNANAQWEADVRLTNATESSCTKSNWCIAANGNVVHVVWYDNRDSNWEIYYKRSTDGGVTWDSDTRLTNNGGNSQSPSIACSGSNVHVVWNGHRDDSLEIYYKHSTDGGVTWGADTRLTNNGSNSQSPSIACSGSNVHVVWHDPRDGNLEIYYKHSTDGGVTWGADTRLTNASSVSCFPSIACSGLNLHVVWRDERNANWEVYYKRSTDGGTTWGSDTRLASDSAGSEKPSIAVAGTVVHVVWEYIYLNSGNWEIYYKRSTDGGLTWGANTRLTYAISDSWLSSIAVIGSFVHVVWMDKRDGNEEIYYKRSTDGGINWGADTRLTNNTSWSEFPSIAVSGSFVHVAWCDYRDGNFEIYYKRNPTGNLIGIQNISTEIPSYYSLSQNYPNPFNPSTTIRYELPRSGSVRLAVYDVMGREVETLVNERQAAGSYEATFEGSRFASGVYFYRLTAEGYGETRKMLIIR
ncbi:MAG: exo-alpha-sialidase [Ignavibacteriae bacterium]|nr:exo-alpha-sialidase [Ignavibacteriota bacterium]